MLVRQVRVGGSSSDAFKEIIPQAEKDIAEMHSRRHAEYASEHHRSLNRFSPGQVLGPEIVQEASARRREHTTLHSGTGLQVQPDRSRPGREVECPDSRQEIRLSTASSRASYRMARQRAALQIFQIRVAQQNHCGEDARRNGTRHTTGNPVGSHPESANAQTEIRLGRNPDRYWDSKMTNGR